MILLAQMSKVSQMSKGSRCLGNIKIKQLWGEEDRDSRFRRPLLAQMSKVSQQFWGEEDRDSRFRRPLLA
jgi:hypothetical protein